MIEDTIISIKNNMKERRQLEGLSMNTETTVKAILFSSIAFALIGSLKMLFNIIVSRSFGTDSILILGMTNVALSFALLISMIISTGLTNSMNKFVSDYISRNDKSSARLVYERNMRINLIIVLPFVIIIGIFSNEIGGLLGVDVAYIYFSLPIIFFSSFYYLIRATFYSLKDSKGYLKREIVADVSFFIVLFILITFNSFASILLSFSALYVVFIVISIKKIDENLPKIKAIGSSEKNPILSYASLTTIGTIMSMATAYLPNILTSSISGARAAALFAVAYSVIMIVLLIPNVMSQVLLPRVSGLWGRLKVESIRRAISLWTASLIIVCGIVIGLMIILCEDILNILFGEEYVDAKPTLILLLIGVFMISVSRPSNIALIGTKYVKISAIVSIIAFCIALIIWNSLIRIEGELGAAMGYLAAAIINSLGSIFYAGKLWSVNHKSSIVPIFMIVFLLILILTLIPLDTITNRIFASGLYLVTFIAPNWNRISFLWKEIRQFDESITSIE